MLGIVGQDGYEVPGLELPNGTLVKWIYEKTWWNEPEQKTERASFVRHTEQPIPERLWTTLKLNPEKSYMEIEDWRETVGPYSEPDTIIIRFVTSRIDR